MRDLDDRLAERERVADADAVLEQAGDGEVLAEGAGRQLDPELAAPSGEVLGRVHADRLLRASVYGPIGLFITRESLEAQADRPVDDPALDRSASPVERRPSTHEHGTDPPDENHAGMPVRSTSSPACSSRADTSRRRQAFANAASAFG